MLRGKPRMNTSDAIAALPQEDLRIMKTVRRVSILSILCSLCCRLSATGDEVPVAPEILAGPEDAIWIEGESAAAKNVVNNAWYGNAIKRGPLSGGDWLSHFDNAKDGTASYEFNVVKAGDYSFWIRSNPIQLGLDWQLDGGDWNTLKNAGAVGQQNLAADDKPDLRFIAWINAGGVKLAEGKHALAFKLYGNGKNGGPHHGVIDCFVFSRVPFSPQGARRPSVPGESKAGDWFPVIAGDDTFGKDSVIDMSALVPAPAGQFGFLKAAGKELQFEKSAPPFKIWGCGANLETGKYSPEQQEQRAKYLRKFGINCVREHPLFDDIATDGKIDAKKFDEYDRWFATLKKNGIYTGWSVFYHFPISKADGYDADLFPELQSMNKDGSLRDSYGLITISPKLWEIRNKIMAEVLAHKNPYTGLRYADDPALAIVEMQNEDSVFFWNPLGGLADGKKWPNHKKLLGRAWCAWAKIKYGSDDAVRKAWGKFDEHLDGGELKIHSPWELGEGNLQGSLAGQPQRAAEYTRFLAEMQRGFFTTCEKLIRDTGFKGVTMTTAWDAGARAQEAADIYCDTIGSMIDRHSYAGGGPGDWRILEGAVRNGSHLPKPGAYLFGLAQKQVDDKPFCVTEWTMSPATQCKLECAPIFAFYGMGLHGWDASFHFAQTGTRIGDGWPHESSFSTDTPHYIGQFPALAFAIAKGHIKESPDVSLRCLDDGQVFSGRDELKQKFWEGGRTIGEVKTQNGTPAEAFAIGRTTVAFGESKTELADFAKYWDESKRVIESATGELTWDYGNEVITVHARKTQAVIGKVMDKTISLPGVTAGFKTPFVSVIFTPLDDAPLGASKHILVTALARDRQAGASYSPDGSKLEKKGAPPLLLEPVQATLKFTGAKPSRVRALDHYGNVLREVPVSDDGTVQIDGRWRAYYYDVSR